MRGKKVEENIPTFADHAIAFNKRLLSVERRLEVDLPAGYQLMNPFARGEAMAISRDFYRLFYADGNRRRMIFGINPGRHGAGLTGVPFTDSKHLAKLRVDARGITSFEVSAVFIYKMIAAYGGAEKFYCDFYINSPLPLGLLCKNARGNLVNANYYDSARLTAGAQPVITDSMRQYQKMPIKTDIAYCLGQGKNYRYLQKLNATEKYFMKIVPLAHPRYIMQYQSKNINRFIDEYLNRLRGD